MDPINITIPKMLAYRLDKNIDSEKLVNDINKMLSKESGDKSQMVLVVSLKHLSQESVCLIPKLEHKT